MEVTTETVAPREVEFTIYPQPEQVEEARRKAARKVAQRVRIPGFRPGKAPYALVERTVGKELLTEEAAEIMAPDLLKQILDQGDYAPFDRPTLTIVQQEPLEIKIRMPLEPKVELADYCTMQVEPEPEVQVTPEQEEELLSELRQQHGTWVPVERPAAMGDQVTLDIKGTAGDEEIFDETGTQIVLKEDLSPPGLAEAIAGMTPGQAREFSLTYPQDHPQEQLAGKTVGFAVTLRELKERKLPALDDEFARSLGDYESLDDLRARLRQGLQAQLETEARDRLAGRVLDQLVEQSQIEYPSLAVEREVDGLLRRQESRLRQQGFTLESYLQVIRKSLPQFRDELRPQAEETLRRSLVLTAVARAEKIQVEPGELQAAISEVAESYGEQAGAVAEALRQAGPASTVFNQAYTRKTLSRLVDVVTGQAEGACQAPEEGPAEAPSEAEPQPPAES